MLTLEELKIEYETYSKILKTCVPKNALFYSGCCCVLNSLIKTIEARRNLDITIENTKRETNRTQLEYENTEFDYGHNIKHKLED